MERLIPVTNLSPSTTTRPRGNQAYRSLKEHLKSGESVSVDLRGPDLISISFLDEIVMNLKDSDLLDKVTFIFTDRAVQQRIARIAAFRQASIFCKRSESEPREPITPQPSPDLQLKPRKRAAG